MRCFLVCMAVVRRLHSLALISVQVREKWAEIKLNLVRARTPLKFQTTQFLDLVSILFRTNLIVQRCIFPNSLFFYLNSYFIVPWLACVKLASILYELWDTVVEFSKVGWAAKSEFRISIRRSEHDCTKQTQMSTDWLNLSKLVIEVALDYGFRNFKIDPIRTSWRNGRLVVKGESAH